MKWESKLIMHGGTSRIAVLFEKNSELIARIKTITGSRWSNTLGVWHLPDTDKTDFDSSFRSTPLLSYRKKEFYK